jgi:hypothetical protein
MILQRFSRNKKKEKDNTAFKTAHNHARDVIYMVAKIEGCILPNFEVQG